MDGFLFIGTGLDSTQQLLVLKVFHLLRDHPVRFRAVLFGLLSLGLGSPAFGIHTVVAKPHETRADLIHQRIGTAWTVLVGT